MEHRRGCKLRRRPSNAGVRNQPLNLTAEGALLRLEKVRLKQHRLCTNAQKKHRNFLRVPVIINLRRKRKWKKIPLKVSLFLVAAFTEGTQFMVLIYLFSHHSLLAWTEVLCSSYPCFLYRRCFGFCLLAFFQDGLFL